MRGSLYATMRRPFVVRVACLARATGIALEKFALSQRATD
jgi:hypothetical protein